MNGTALAFPLIRRGWTPRPISRRIPKNWRPVGVTISEVASTRECPASYEKIQRRRKYRLRPVEAVAGRLGRARWWVEWSGCRLCRRSRLWREDPDYVGTSLFGTPSYPLMGAAGSCDEEVKMTLRKTDTPRQLFRTFVGSNTVRRCPCHMKEADRHLVCTEIRTGHKNMRIGGPSAGDDDEERGRHHLFWSASIAKIPDHDDG
jgi:hypothetical protein